MRSVLIVSAFLLGFAATAQAQTAAPAKPVAATAVAATSDEPIPRTERAKARQDCVSENVALSGDDLRAAMRLCMQAKFPGVRLYAQDGVTRDGKPSAHFEHTVAVTADGFEVLTLRADGSSTH